MEPCQPVLIGSLSRQAKTVFELSIKNKDGKEQSWLIDLKKEGKVVKGKPEGVKPDVTLIMDGE